MSTIGSRLRKERERLKMNQAAFGELGGVLKQAQLKYEKNDRSPDAEYLSAIALAGVDIAYVLTGIQSGCGASNPREAALLDNYRNSALAVQIGVSKLLAETGSAVERAESVTYEPLPGGLAHGTQSNAVHGTDSENVR